MEELKSPVLLIGVLVMWPMLFDLIYKVIHLFLWEPIGLPQTVLFLYLVVMVVHALLVEFRLIQNISNKRNVFRVYLALFANKNLLYLFHPKFLEVIVFVDYFFQLFKWVFLILIDSVVFTPPRLVGIFRKVWRWRPFRLRLLLQFIERAWLF